jgi:DNA-binding GntR family transcriptional regulator
LLSDAYQPASSASKSRDAASLVYDAVRSRYRDPWRQGDPQPLPPEYELMKEFQAPRSAVRTALTQLAAEGVLTRARRSGTIPVLNSVRMEIADVKTPAPTREGETPRQGDERDGRRWTVPANASLAARLSVEQGERVDAEEATVFHEGTPFAVRTRYFVEGLLPDNGLHGYALNSESRIEQAGLQIGRIDSTFEAITCDAELAPRLNYVPGAPILLRRVMFRDSRLVPLVWTVFRMRGDRTVMHMTREVDVEQDQI